MGLWSPLCDYNWEEEVRKQKEKREETISAMVDYINSLTQDELDGIQEFIKIVGKHHEYKRLRKERKNIDKQIEKLRRDSHE